MGYYIGKDDRSVLDSVVDPIAIDIAIAIAAPAVGPAYRSIDSVLDPTATSTAASAVEKFRLSWPLPTLPFFVAVAVEQGSAYCGRRPLPLSWLQLLRG